ncbi:MAG: 2-oxoacid:acceptor oxidoreductase subunit alpha [Candidatus Bathyarchaeota archaeon]|nr:MAG: 2-oxoacid:acceptor oxidoreductase subunit alpha [Candidatus Bathyarchaeota archaeon]
MQGNKALAEGAVAAGCRFFAGYPITPASEIAEHLAVRLPHVGGIMIQMEDEIASLASVIGASWAGTKSMTATSGPGFSLMQESIGYAFMTETPCVIVDVQRAGPSTGQATKGGQGDVMQARWGTHGDYASIVLSPNSVQEMYDLTIRAFNLAEEFRTPVILLSDEVTSHMREQITVPPADHVEIRTRTPPRVGEPYFGGTLVPPMPSVGEGFDVVVTGSTHNEVGLRFTADPTVHSALVTRLVGKIEVAAQSMMDCETFNLDGCDVGFISFGCTSRAVYEAVETLEEQGISAGFVRLRTIWPFPEKYVRELAEQARVVIVPEMNLKQIYYEVQRVVDGAARVVPVNQIGGGELVTPETLCHVAKEATDKL